MTRPRFAALWPALLGLRAGLLAGVIAGLAAAPASAQSSVPSASPAANAPQTNLDSKPGTLSDKLSDTNGVIKPTGDVDPAMRKGAPQAGSMPVIKPGSVAPGTAK